MDRLATAEGRLTTLLDRLDALAADPARATQVPQARFDAQGAERDRLKADVDALALALDEARETNHRQEVRIAEMARELDELRGAAASADGQQGEAGELTQRLADAEYVAEEALNQLEATKAELSTVRAQLTSLETAKAERQAELFRAETANEGAGRKLDQTIARLDRFIAE